MVGVRLQLFSSLNSFSNSSNYESLVKRSSSSLKSSQIYSTSFKHAPFHTRFAKAAILRAPKWALEICLSRLEGEERLHLTSFYADSRSSPPGHRCDRLTHPSVYQIRSHCDVKSRTDKEESLTLTEIVPKHLFTCSHHVSQIKMLTATTQMLSKTSLGGE